MGCYFTYGAAAVAAAPLPGLRAITLDWRERPLRSHNTQP